MTTKTIQSLLETLPVITCVGSKEKIIEDLTIDSRTAALGMLFIAQKGETVDGHDFIDGVIEKGAEIIVCEILPSAIKDTITYIQVTDTHHATGIIAEWFYEFPAKQLTIIGVTGTNGKTTVATLLWQSFRLLGHKTGLISTVSYWIDDKEIPSTHTTPGALVLQKLFRTMLNTGCSHVVMEVSSHAIAQDRISGIDFRAGIFTNLTQDHLDFHKTMENYRDTKKKFFTTLSSNSIAITNSDDENGAYMIDTTFAKKVSYGISHAADYKAENISLNTQGSTFELENSPVYSMLLGSFNLSNSLAVYATLRELGYAKDIVISLRHISQPRYHMKMRETTMLVLYHSNVI